MKGHEDRMRAAAESKAAKDTVVPTPPRSPGPSQPARKAAYDECTLRMSFIEMDGNANGVVTKEEFINYVRSRPPLQNMMYCALKGKADEVEDSQKSSPGTPRALGIKRVLSVYKGIDVNRNGCLSWDEFLDFFRRTGLLIVYSTPDNPRDRMATELGKEYQRRQAMAKWQRGGRELGVGQQVGWDKLITETDLHSTFLLEQKQQQLNTQWANERLAAMQRRHAQRRDAFSILTDSVDEFRMSAQQVSRRPGRKYVTIAGCTQQDSTPEAPGTVVEETTSASEPQELRPTTPTTPRTARPKTAPSKTLEMESRLVEDISKPPLSGTTSPVQPSAPALHLPILKNDYQVKQPLQTPCCKSPMRRKGRSYSNVCERSGEQKCDQAKNPMRSPRRSLSRRKTTKSPTAKRGQTPRRCAEVTSLVI